MTDATLTDNGHVADEPTDEAEEKAFALRMLEYLKPVGLLEGKMMALWDPADWIGELGYLPVVVIQDFSALLDADVIVGYSEGLKWPDEYVRDLIE